MQLPVTVADGHIVISSVATALVFEHEVFLQPGGVATIVLPDDPANPKHRVDRQYGLLDVYPRLIDFATQYCTGETLIVSVGPETLAQLIGSRQISLWRLAAKDGFRILSGDTWEFYFPANDTFPELLLYVNPRWAGTTTAGMRRD